MWVICCPFKKWRPPQNGGRILFSDPLKRIEFKHTKNGALKKWSAKLVSLWTDSSAFLYHTVYHVFTKKCLCILTFNVMSRKHEKVGLKPNINKWYFGRIPLWFWQIELFKCNFWNHLIIVAFMSIPPP